MKKSKIGIFFGPLALVACSDFSPSKATMSDVEVDKLLKKAESGNRDAMVSAFTYYDSIENGSAGRRLWMINLAEIGDINFIERLYQEDLFEAKVTKIKIISCDRASNALKFAKKMQSLQRSSDVQSDIFEIRLFLKHNCNEL